LPGIYEGLEVAYRCIWHLGSINTCEFIKDTLSIVMGANHNVIVLLIKTGIHHREIAKCIDWQVCAHKLIVHWGHRMAVHQSLMLH